METITSTNTDSILFSREPLWPNSYIYGSYSNPETTTLNSEDSKTTLDSLENAKKKLDAFKKALFRELPKRETRRSRRSKK